MSSPTTAPTRHSKRGVERERGKCRRNAVPSATSVERIRAPLEWRERTSLKVPPSRKEWIRGSKVAPRREKLQEKRRRVKLDRNAVCSDREGGRRAWLTRKAMLVMNVSVVTLVIRALP